MDANTAGDLLGWVTHIGVVHGLTLTAADNGAYGFRTAVGAMVGIEPTPVPHVLIFTGQLGTADDEIGVRKLKALLAVNMAAGLSGTGYIGLEPTTNALLIRLVWTPALAEWQQEAFTSVVTAFTHHVDALSAALANGQIEAILASAQEEPPGGHSPQFA